MAIIIHIAEVNALNGVRRVKENLDDAPNSEGTPTVKEYIKLEAADNFALSSNSGFEIVTYDVASMNAL